MKRKMIPLTLGIIISLLLAPFGLRASDSDQGQDELLRVRKKIETLRAWRLSEILDLDEETSARLFAAMREADEEGWRVEVLNRTLMRDLVLELEKGEKDPGRLAWILDRLQANRMEKARAEDRHLSKVREILSPEDTARYLVFQVNFQQELREKAARALMEEEGRSDRRDMKHSTRDSDGSGGSMSGGKKK